MSAGKERGFTLAGALLLIGVLGAGMAAYGEFASHAAQREKEQELLFVGNQFRQAIRSYYEQSPGAAKRFPQKLEDLLLDNRHPMPVRHLRKLYADPMSGKADWAAVVAPQGGIMGVHSRSEAAPIKTWGFAQRDSLFQDTARYSQWHFSHAPLTSPLQGQPRKTPSG